MRVDETRSEDLAYPVDDRSPLVLHGANGSYAIFSYKDIFRPNRAAGTIDHRGPRDDELVRHRRILPSSARLGLTGHLGCRILHNEEDSELGGTTLVVAFFTTKKMAMVIARPTIESAIGQPMPDKYL